MTILLLVLLIIALIISIGFFYSSRATGEGLAKTTITIRHQNGKTISTTFVADLANNSLKRTKGLSGREMIGEKEGMLFIFDKPSKQGFWMAGMNFPLDFVWIAGDEVVGVSEDVSHKDQTSLHFPPRSVDKVLEINAGMAEKFGIKEGDKISLGL